MVAKLNDDTIKPFEKDVKEKQAERPAGRPEVLFRDMFAPFGAS